MALLLAGSKVFEVEPEFARLGLGVAANPAV
jgi:hypothetical protein